ncbi:MAG: hypothetical protein M5U12_03485 [Verrucomicrobia bacterium]|nr:hypothetical protein [Verrucomicrobiota bacterium]
MKSMTGYGRGEASRDGFKVTVEVSSVNRKQSEVYLSLPRELEPLEARIRETIHQQVARGRLSAKIQLETKGNAWRGRVRFNEPLARAYAAEFTKLSRSLRLSGGSPLRVSCACRAWWPRMSRRRASRSFGRWSKPRSPRPWPVC